MAKNKTRIQLDFSDKSMELLDRLKGELGASSNAEVIRRCMWFMGLALLKYEGDLVHRKPDGSEQIIELV